jgi:hypothetical protein
LAVLPGIPPTLVYIFAVYTQVKAKSIPPGQACGFSTEGNRAETATSNAIRLPEKYQSRLITNLSESLRVIPHLAYLIFLTMTGRSFLGSFGGVSGQEDVKKLIWLIYQGLFLIGNVHPGLTDRLYAILARCFLAADRSHLEKPIFSHPPDEITSRYV